MRIGVDTFTLRDLHLDPVQQLETLARWGLEGAQFGGLRGLANGLDQGRLKEIRARADELGMYSHVSISATCNPHGMGATPDVVLAGLTEEVEAAAACGWHELHGSLGGGDERYVHPVPWTQQLVDSTRFIRRLGPVLRQHGSRLNLETHGDSTTFELVRLVEEVGPEIAGICLDTANVLCHAEDPVAAAQRAAPYTHLTHLKDGIVFFTDRGVRRQTLPPGQGALDWTAILPILAQHQPDLPVSIEDHKWLFDFHCFEPRWLALHPDLTREEFAAFMRLTWQCQQRLLSGELPDPDLTEQTPHVEEVEDRLRAGGEYLKALVRRLGLEDRGVAGNPLSLSMLNRAPGAWSPAASR
ncbi:MAG: sugar phosphate isomerase/epimerase family protein [Candidatus Latescibacterota bacterium]|jgi:sugar phosphate isomerase/epimerase